MSNDLGQPSTVAGMDLLGGDALGRLDEALLLQDASAGPWDPERKVDKGYDGELERELKGDTIGFDEQAQLNYLAGACCDRSRSRPAR